MQLSKTRRSTPNCLPRGEASPDMEYELVWLPDVLQNAGLKVATVDGWKSRRMPKGTRPLAFRLRR